MLIRSEEHVVIISPSNHKCGGWKMLIRREECVVMVSLSNHGCGGLEDAIRSDKLKLTKPQ